jgi:hypothetical protein
MRHVFDDQCGAVTGVFPYEAQVPGMHTCQKCR